jgi:hypothetical protein
VGVIGQQRMLSPPGIKSYLAFVRGLCCPTLDFVFAFLKPPPPNKKKERGMTKCVFTYVSPIFKYVQMSYNIKILIFHSNIIKRVAQYPFISFGQIILR